MTVLCTADWHLNDNPRDRYRHEFQPYLLQLIERHSVTHLLILGDLTDEKDHHGAVLVNEIVGYLEKLARVCQVTVLTGNHDCIDPSNPFFAFTSNLPNVMWITKPMSERGYADLGNVLFLPHTRDHRLDWETLDEERLFNWVFTHNTFTGAKSSSGRELAGIPISALPRDTPVISGDVHVPQNVGPVTYAGAPYTIDFGDTFKPRVILIEDQVVCSVSVPGPQKRLIKAIDGADARRKLASISPGDMVKVRMGWDSTKFEEWVLAKKELMNWAVKEGIALKGVEPILDGKAKPKKYKVPGKPASDTEVLADYCEANAVSKLLSKVGRILLKG